MLKNACFSVFIELYVQYLVGVNAYSHVTALMGLVSTETAEII